MTRPDPARAPIAECFAYIFARIDEIATAQASERKACVLTIEDLAKRYGVSRSAIGRNPWKLPRFGKPDIIGKGGARAWYLSTVEAMEAIPEPDRRATWETMSAKEKREALGVSA
jgi:hypothetical protein